MRVSPEVADALAEHRPVVALESTIISHGLPRGDNLRIAGEIEAAVRAGGAVPATVAVVDGTACVGLGAADLERIAIGDDVVKAGVRDLAVVVARGGAAGTTVASTVHLAARAGIGVLATGGIGGVHRQARESFDESADLTTLSRTPVLVVCSGVKSILDVPATLERLETLNVAVLGYRTEAFPGFYLADSGCRVGWRVESATEVARVVRACRQVGTDGCGVLLANPIPAGAELDRGLHDRVLTAGLAAAAASGVHGKDVTPFLLDYFHRETRGASLAANVALILSNAQLAAQVAVASGGFG